MRFLSALSVLALLVAGCSKESSDRDDSVEGDDDRNTRTGDTVETGAPEPKRVAEVRFRALIAWDAGLRQVVAPIIDGSDNYISAYIIDLYEAGWSSSVESSFCQVAVRLEGLPGSPTAASEGFLWGIDVPEGDKEALSDCASKGFDESQWTNGDVSAHWVAPDWRLRLGGTLSPDLIDWLTPDTPPDDFDIASYMAGDWSTETGGYATDADNNYWYAYAMDSEYNVDFDVRLLDHQVASGIGEVITAYYVWDQRVYWNLTSDG